MSTAPHALLECNVGKPTLINWQKNAEFDNLQLGKDVHELYYVGRVFKEELTAPLCSFFARRSSWWEKRKICGSMTSDDEHASLNRDRDTPQTTDTTANVRRSTVGHGMSPIDDRRSFDVVSTT